MEKKEYLESSETIWISRFKFVTPGGDNLMKNIFLYNLKTKYLKKLSNNLSSNSQLKIFFATIKFDYVLIDW